ncbi:AHH domain-containing protein [Novosphingobium beihaiensis]|uniref:AHH domain-containing protein n=1 Tax=Novosphingobium beihaiensis TaxID=2930389 RepID=A0ABT0BQP4_9SPHN|nr:AHH domain-containing protein [Novosphingobium beihaiensis]MCJ2187369.1 AHH domain-containing protein [Novosphingobium beihaiensis]
MPRQTREYLSFRAVNNRCLPGYDAGLQRHHLLPRQVLSRPAFARMFAAAGGRRHRFDDFRENGLLLPCREAAAIRLGLPLHRGPHRCYSSMVMERIGQIEAGWSEVHPCCARDAAVQVHMRLALLQRALRRFLLTGKRRAVLNRRDPQGAGIDFSSLDAMADALWGATAPPPDVAPQPMPERARSSSLAA